MREGGAYSVPALLAMGGVDLGYWLSAKWPDDQAILDALAVEISETRRKERENLAAEIAKEILEGLDRSLK